MNLSSQSSLQSSPSQSSLQSSPSHRVREYDLNELSMRQNALVSAAMTAAIEGKRVTNYGYSHGAICSSNGRIIGIGFNHPRNRLRKRKLSSFHAEVDVLSQILRGTQQPYYSYEGGEYGNIENTIVVAADNPPSTRHYVLQRKQCQQ